jgi:hypothetical protein
VRRKGGLRGESRICGELGFDAVRRRRGYLLFGNEGWLCCDGNTVGVPNVVSPRVAGPVSLQPRILWICVSACVGQVVFENRPLGHCLLLTLRVESITPKCAFCTHFGGDLFGGDLFGGSAVS